MNIKIGIVVCFHYNENRIKFLNNVIEETKKYCFKNELIVLTNKKNTDFEYVGILDHPYDLTWKQVVYMTSFLIDPTFTHNMYIEDDILVTQENID
jgi:hypothetical protein